MTPMILIQRVTMTRRTRKAINKAKRKRRNNRIQNQTRKRRKKIRNN